MSEKRKRSASSEVDQEIKMAENVSQMEVPSSLEEMYECKELSDITKCFVNLHNNMTTEISNIKSEIKDVRKTVGELQTSLEYTQSEVAEICEYNLPQIVARIERERIERLKLEMWGRKWNVTVTGIQGTTQEDTESTEKLVRSFFIKKLSVPKERVDRLLFQAVHRLPGGKLGKNNIMVRFLSLTDRDRVLQAARNLPPKSGHAVYIDLPPEIAKLRLDLLEKRRNLPEEEKKTLQLKYLKEEPFIELVKKKKKKVNASPDRENGVGRGRGRGKVDANDIQRM